MAGWMNDRWSMRYLAPQTRQELADALDVISPLGLGYPKFAAALRINGNACYTAQEIELIRSDSGRMFLARQCLVDHFQVRSSGSPTMALLQDFEQRGGTIQGVQRALEDIEHVASAVIPNYFRNLAAQIDNLQVRLRGYGGMYSSSPNNGSQNTEFVPCNCARCQSQNQSTNRYERPSEEVSEQKAGRGSSGGSPKHRNSEKRNTRTRSSADNKKNSSLPPTGKTFVSVDSPRKQRVPAKETCPCDECRLRSDPEQTQRFTLDSEPKLECIFEKRFRNGLSDAEQIRQSSKDNDSTASGLSQLYLDSYNSVDSSVESSDETFVKGVFRETNNPERIQSSEQNILSANFHANGAGKKLCSRSDNGAHRLGEVPENCPVCRNYAGAIPKTKSRPRNNSSVADRNEQHDTGLRMSWHGTLENKPEEMLKSWSDSSLSRAQHARRNSDHQNHDHVISDTIYSRISSGSNGSRSAESTLSSNDSVHNLYQNNLESATVVRDAIDSSRNIVQSDSSNFTGDQNPVPTMRERTTSSSSNDNASNYNFNDAAFNPWVRLSHAESDFHKLQRSSSKKDQLGPKVFVTYGWNGNTDSDSFIAEMIQMCVSLRDAGVRVKIDMDDSSYYALRLNKLDWIEKNVREAKYIVVCVTPTYMADVKEPGTTTQASPRVSQLNVRYIFDIVRGEYYENSAQNRRVIPVIFPNHFSTRQHVPECMRSTLIYEYPNSIDQIIEAILGRGRYRPS